MRAGVWTALLEAQHWGTRGTAAPLQQPSGWDGCLPGKPHPLGPSARVQSLSMYPCPATPGNAGRFC